MAKEEMTHEDAIMRLKNIDIRNALQEDYDASNKKIVNTNLSTVNLCN